MKTLQMTAAFLAIAMTQFGCAGGGDTGDTGEGQCYADEDGDGFGDPDESILCSSVEGEDTHIPTAGDCDDDDAAINPDATDDDCDGVDDDCDGVVDKADADGDGVAGCDDCDDDDEFVGAASVWYVDADRDGYGDADTSEVACEAPSGYVAAGTDCDDADRDTYPGAGFNEDASIADECLTDSDGDGYLDPADGGTDCDDTRDDVYPDAWEECDEIDYDCDGYAGNADNDGDGLEGCYDCDDDDPAWPELWAPDNDGDGYGSVDESMWVCEGEEADDGYVEVSINDLAALDLDVDCDDSDPELHPGADEVCDDIDNDCDDPGSDGLDNDDDWLIDEADEYTGEGVDEGGVCDADAVDCSNNSVTVTSTNGETSETAELKTFIAYGLTELVGSPLTADDACDIIDSTEYGDPFLTVQTKRDFATGESTRPATGARPPRRSGAGERGYFPGMTPGLLLGSLLWMLPEPPPLPDGVTARLGSERLRHPWYTKQVAFDASGALVTGAGFTVWSWDPWTGQPQGVLTPPPRVFFNEIVNDFALSPVGDVAVAGASGLYLRRGDEWARLEEGHFEAVDFAPGGGALAAIGPEGGFVRALATGDQVALSKLPDDPKAVALGEGAVFVGGWDTAGAWSAETGRPLWSAEANPSAATTALSPDGRRVAFETWGGLEIRELATGARVAECSAYSLYSAAFGPDGRRLYLGGSDGEIWTCSAEGGWAAEYFVWPEPDAFPDAGIPGDTAAVNGLAVSPDGRLVASIHSDHTARLWSAGAAVPLFVDDGHTRDVSASALSPDGSIAATAGDDGTIRLWSLPSGAPLRTLRGHESFVTDLAFLPDGSLVSTSYDKHAMRWQPGESSPVAGVELTSPAGLHPSPDAVAVGPAGEVIVGGIGGILASVTFVDGSFDEGTVTPLAGGDYEETVNDLALGPGGALYVGGNDGVLRLRLLQGASAPVAAEVTFPDHELAGPVAAADYAPRRGMLSPPDVEAVAVSPDGSRVAACSTHRVGVWDAGLETLYSVVETAGCADLLFLPDGRLVTAERDAWRVRDPTTGAATIERTEHRGAILTLSADGERVLTAGEGTAALVGPIPEAGSP